MTFMFYSYPCTKNTSIIFFILLIILRFSKIIKLYCNHNLNKFNNLKPRKTLRKRKIHLKNTRILKLNPYIMNLMSL